MSKRGLCGVRENISGILYTLVYGKLVSRAVDPIEKKPLFHFLPGTSAYSIATVGCNFKCKNCQNWEISQSPKLQKTIEGYDFTPEEIVREAKHLGCASVAYTYTEPVIFMEYALDTAKIAIKQGIKNLFVTNGYITEEALKVIAHYIHGINIDLKSMNDDFYRKNCGALLEPVLDSIKLHKKLGLWIEITTLIIPELNDSKENIKGIAEFIRDLGTEIPWHVSGFYPAYKLLDIPPTTIETIHKVREIGLESGLRYVYEGNIPGEGEHTYCYKCGERVIGRYGYKIENKIMNGNCPACGAIIDGVWK
jgi:pyruvate formate lyase activating enzyme